MRKTYYTILPIAAVLMLTMFAMAGRISAQENEPPAIPEAPEMEIPFIDRDSDGINDLLQNGWGLRFVERYKTRQELWNQLNAEFTEGEDGRMIDSDGDGVEDTPVHDFMTKQMEGLIDTDGDGEKDTPLRDYLGRRFRSFDQDGDGLPDDLSAEEIRERMDEMRAWRLEIRERVHRGESAFIDDDGDGIPDNLPQRFMQRGKMGGPLGGQGGQGGQR